MAFVATAFISRELARKRHRDSNFYFFVGLFLGPFAVLMIMTPLPNAAEQQHVEEKPVRMVKGLKCPKCRRQVPIRASECPGCGRATDPLWWDQSGRGVSTQL
jgi:hypothetical protein